MVLQCSSLLGLLNAQSILHTVLPLQYVLRFVSTVVINPLINILSPKLKKQISLNFEA